MWNNQTKTGVSLAHKKKFRQLSIESSKESTNSIKSPQSKIEHKKSTN